MIPDCRLCLALASSLLCAAVVCEAQQGETQMHRNVTFYASFDQAVRGDFGGGDLSLSTRFNHPDRKGEFVFEKGFDSKVFRIAEERGVHGGALEAIDVLPRNGRIYFPARGNLAYNDSGWSGSASVWIKTDPNTMFKSRFCDPLQITQKGASNGAIWFDFNDAKPRDMRMGTFPAVAEGRKPVAESDPGAPIVWVKNVGFQASDWHHIAITWDNFDTHKANGRAALYIDGKLIGEVKDKDIAMEWDLDKTGIYIAVSYIGLYDELALFGRALTPAEVARLAGDPALLASLKTARRR
jgi:hypothetical protein